MGNWTGLAGSGGILAIQNAGQSSFEIALSNDGE